VVAHDPRHHDLGAPAAEVLGVDRKTLYSKLKTYGWRPSDPSA